ncbi:CrcB family protein [Halalkalicoccus sp. NIPERK01]|uniref:fluoride efflux transporter FluC n=1 Tax=Halalkalicoccus sp. NIPERK01 TaxID=3053469 RepID=UPI00256F4BB4|nr:CrcB family protein [Halalkalicoccus sp. NIPERK01]MDL5360972.1 CrcB family protein [Halalkalicoccus sp. NIPERK01]
MAPVRPTPLALVAAGGFLGAIARYGVALLAPGLAGTFAVNVTGSFALGYVFYTAATTDRISPRTRLLVATGFLSSYTTYSTFALQTVDAPLTWGALNVLGSYAVGFAAAVLGRRLALGGGR